MRQKVAIVYYVPTTPPYLILFTYSNPSLSPFLLSSYLPIPIHPYHPSFSHPLYLGREDGPRVDRQREHPLQACRRHRHQEGVLRLRFSGQDPC